MSAYCPNCGAPAGNSGKCEYCGAAIPVQQPATPPPVQPVYQQPVYQQPVYPQPPVYQQNVYYGQPAPNLPVKSKLVAILLALFLGGLGVHRFYLNQIGTGVLWLFTGGLFGIGWFVDFIMLLCTSDQAFMRKYNCRLG